RRPLALARAAQPVPVPQAVRMKPTGAAPIRSPITVAAAVVAAAVVVAVAAARLAGPAGLADRAVPRPPTLPAPAGPPPTGGVTVRWGIPAWPWVCSRC
ncbi:MAG: hypothetical protein ACREJ2_18080, partial [Planctomycetota bacterium]